MRNLITASSVLALSVGMGVAQDFELDLDFEDEIVFEDIGESAAPEVAAAEGEAVVDPDAMDDIFADVVEEAPSRGFPDIEFTASYARSDSAGTVTDTQSLRAAVKESFDLGDVGFLEVAASVSVTDPAGAADWDFNLDQVKLQNSSGQLSWAVGKFPIGWGEIEGTPVLDVLNSGLSLATLGTATEDLPGQWVATADYFGQGYTVSGFAGLDPVVSYPVPDPTPSDAMEFGARLSVPIEQGQVSGYAARLLPQAAVMAFDGSASSAEPYTLIGASAHKAVGSVLLEADFAAKLGLERATATGFAEDDRIDAALGAEIALSNSTQLTGNVAVQRWMDGSAGYFDFGAAGPVAANQTSATYQLALTTSAANEKLSLSAFTGGSFDGDTSFLAAQGEYSLTDDLSVSASASRLSAATGSLLAPLDGTTTISVGLTYYFR